MEKFESCVTTNSSTDGNPEHGYPLVISPRCPQAMSSTWWRISSWKTVLRSMLVIAPSVKNTWSSSLETMLLKSRREGRIISAVEVCLRVHTREGGYRWQHLGRGYASPGPSLGAAGYKVLRCRQPVALHAHMFYIYFSFVTLHVSFVLLASVVQCFSFSVAAQREIVREMTQENFPFST